MIIIKNSLIKEKVLIFQYIEKRMLKLKKNLKLMKIILIIKKF